MIPDPVLPVADLDNKVRQGASLQVARLATQASGTMHFKWKLFGEIDGIDFGPTTIDQDNVTTR